MNYLIPSKKKKKNSFLLNIVGSLPLKICVVKKISIDITAIITKITKTTNLIVFSIKLKVSFSAVICRLIFLTMYSLYYCV